MPAPNQVVLINNRKASGDWQQVPSGRYGFGYECADWNGSSVKLQWSRTGDDADAQDIEATDYASNAVVNGLDLMGGYVKAVVIGTPDEDMFAYIGSVSDGR